MWRQAALARGVVWGAATTVLAFGCGKSQGGPPAGNAGSAGAAQASGGASAATGSGQAGTGDPTSGSGGDPGTAGAADAGAGADCTGLGCNVPVCPTGTTTSISGKVFDPSGTLPLYGVSVFIPNAPVPELGAAASCDRCGEGELPSVVRTLSDVSGSFVLEGVPAGPDIPLVIQLGRWRRQLTLPSVAACVDQPLDAAQTRLPRNKLEGDIPRIAIVTSGQDQLECFPRRLGIDDTEFTTSTGDGRIHLYAGAINDLTPGITQFAPALNGGAILPHATDLWTDLASLQRYDMVILACEGNVYLQEKPILSRQAMYDYASAGGRVFASHWQHAWFSEGPEPVATIGTWQDRQDPTDLGGTLSATVNQTFPKGAALAQWLVDVGASATLGSLSVTSPRDNIQSVNPALAREWLSADNPNYPAMAHVVEAMSFTTPVGAPAGEACGRVAFTDLHVSTTLASPGDPVPPGFPLNCEQRAISAQEQAMAFLFFQLGACIGED